jgi:small subunit ribosomal protein S3
MGQKVSPVGFRLRRKRSKVNPEAFEAQSRWYAEKLNFSKWLIEDQKIRQWLQKHPNCRTSSSFHIQRMGEKVQVIIHTSRPGVVIGKKGAGIEQLRNELKSYIGQDVWIEVFEIKRPDLDARLVAKSIVQQLQRRFPFRRIIKRAIQASLDAGALGIKVQLSGRIRGAEIARTEWYKEGQIPLHTLRANIDYALEEANTSFGVLGVKVWINRGQVQE